MEYLQIRKATTKDLGTVQLIGRETFFETFADSNTEEDMKKYLEDSFNDDQLSVELSNPDSLFYIAWEDESPVGYLKLNKGNAQTETLDEMALEIERIYVKTSHHGKKVGQLLYEKALEVAQQQHNSYLWLGVWEKNPRAIKFYEKNGFKAFDKHIFKMGNDEQVDIMMKKEL
ncbi:GNAT family N-acetyltransferase [Pedobacter nyackensis]|uniref:Spermine/spermidine N-acetyltransferase n=1 Tax=Pedobacter nyackensis TaxID=475255 RepID=A0A1W2A8T5_9SPHI|nr:GNAT family N-acetyltransferase [Pedobacter nyackensis]SMC57135.1 spermine/spermidine N-acetyltransferase [Pedobacter nyackensis]